MGELVRCARCKKILIDEEYDSHDCNPINNGWKNVKAAYYYITKDSQKQEVIFIVGLDGIDYNFTIIQKHESDKRHLSTENLQDKSSTEEFDSTTFKVLFHYRVIRLVLVRVNCRALLLGDSRAPQVNSTAFNDHFC